MCFNFVKYLNLMIKIWPIILFQDLSCKCILLILLLISSFADRSYLALTEQEFTQLPTDVSITLMFDTLRVTKCTQGSYVICLIKHLSKEVAIMPFRLKCIKTSIKQLKL